MFEDRFQESWSDQIFVMLLGTNLFLVKLYQGVFGWVSGFLGGLVDPNDCGVSLGFSLPSAGWM